MAYQAPSSSSKPLARWLKPVTPLQHPKAESAKLAKSVASKRAASEAPKPSGASSRPGRHLLSCCMSS
eukprot:1156785-Pelagomonas_calceolata.AAC.17